MDKNVLKDPNMKYRDIKQNLSSHSTLKTYLLKVINDFTVPSLRQYVSPEKDIAVGKNVKINIQVYYSKNSQCTDV